MEKVSGFFGAIVCPLSKADAGFLLTVDICALCAVFVACMLFCIFSKRVRPRAAGAFLCVCNFLTALTFSIACSAFGVGQAAAGAALFWAAGYALKSVVALTANRAEKSVTPNTAPMGVRSAYVRPQPAAPQAPAAKSSVKLEHALSISDRLLVKNLGRGDRQELEKMKTALTVMRVKDGLTPEEGEALNETFNSLLKLMAKYGL